MAKNVFPGTMKKAELPKAPEGQKWVMNIMTSKWILEDKSTPYACSVASESYW